MRSALMTRATISALVALSSAGCQQLGGDPRSLKVSKKTAEEVRSSIAAIAAAYNAHDAVKTASFDAPEYIAMFHGSPTTVGPDADIAAMKLQMADPAAKFEPHLVRVTVGGEGTFANARSTYTYSFTDPKTKAVAKETGNWIAEFERRSDGTLKLIWSIGADEPPIMASAPKA